MLLQGIRNEHRHSIPCFQFLLFSPHCGKVELGIAAVNQAGNESDNTKISASLDFTVPEAPKLVWLEA